MTQELNKMSSIFALGGKERGNNVSATILNKSKAIMIIFLVQKNIKIKGSLTFNYFKSNSKGRRL